MVTRERETLAWLYEDFKMKRIYIYCEVFFISRYMILLTLCIKNYKLMVTREGRILAWLLEDLKIKRIDIYCQVFFISFYMILHTFCIQTL